MSSISCRTVLVSVWVLAAAIMAASPVDGWATNLFALLDTGELYASADNGATWVPRTVLPVRDAVGLAAGATSNDLFLVTRSGSVYQGKLGSRNVWTPVGAIPASDVAAFTIGPFGALLALTSTGSVYSSSDQGATFVAMAALAGSNWVSLARGPLGRFYALTATGQVAESRDQGASWTTVGVIAVSNAVAIRRLGNNLYVLSKTGEIYRSINYGASWTAVGALTSSSMGALVDLESFLVATAAEGEVASSSDGSAWTWVGAVNQLRVIALATDAPMVTGVAEQATAPRFMVRAPFPNPTTGAAGAVFSFSIEGPARLRARLYDAQGRLVAERQEQPLASGGEHAFHWAPGDLPSGTYFVRFSTSTGQAASRKWILVR